MKKYGPFLIDLHDALVAALMDAENLEMHHAATGSAEEKHYRRLVEVLSHIEERYKWYKSHEPVSGG